jgi:hypothetical protein
MCFTVVNGLNRHMEEQEEEEDLLPLRLAVMQCHPVPILSEHHSFSSVTAGLIYVLIRLWNWFTSVDLDRSGSITAIELGL